MESHNSFKSPFVERGVPLEIDEGAMLAVDNANVIEVKNDGKHEDYIKNLSRDNAQLLINRLWQLPTERVDNIIVATLPTRTTVIPREKPVPKAKPLTRWQEYRKSKGIQTRKRDKMVWDEAAKEFRPRWGYKRANDDSANKWMVELPENGNMSEDPFEKARTAKKERVAKNDLQRLRNIARSEKLTVPHNVSSVGAKVQDTDQLTRAFHEATRSTASLGKFVRKVPHEPVDRRVGKKQKFESNLVDRKVEHDRQMRIIDEIQSKKPILNVEKAANRQIVAENKEQRLAKKDQPKKGGKKNKRAWIPPDKFAKASKRAEKKVGGGSGGRGGGKKAGGKAAAKTRSMLKRSK